MVCRKCKSHRLGIRVNPKNAAAKDLYCLDCGAWQKFANADDCRIYPATGASEQNTEREKSRWEWFEEWTESGPDGPRECTAAGWRCRKCGFDLTELAAQFDDPDAPPELNFCPECGVAMR